MTRKYIVQATPTARNPEQCSLTSLGIFFVYKEALDVMFSFNNDPARMEDSRSAKIKSVDDKDNYYQCPYTPPKYKDFE